MPDYAALGGVGGALGRRRRWRARCGFWTAVLDGWAAGRAGALEPLAVARRSAASAGSAGVPLLAEAAPEIPTRSVEELLGPVMERLAAGGPETRRSAPALRGRPGMAAQWGRADLFPARARIGRPRSRSASASGPPAWHSSPTRGCGPALETYFAAVRELPDGVWTAASAPGAAAPGYGDLVEDGRRRLSCHLCGGAWIAPRLRCPFCESWESRDLVRLLGEGVEEGYFIEACRSCHGYLKGVDRRQRWNAGVAARGGLGLAPPRHLRGAGGVLARARPRSPSSCRPRARGGDRA